MKNLKIILSALCVCSLFLPAYAANITIIESLSGNTWAVQDSVWYDVGIGMGHDVEVVPQSTLEDLANLETTDVLVVASGTLDISPQALQTVKDFVLSGRSAYVQAEYLLTMQGTITFDEVMQAVGADFAWTSPISGQLVPMNIFGPLANTPNVVTSIGYFNYGYAGEGEDVEPFLEYEGDFFGFCYTDPTETYGAVITISDEDWAWQNYSPSLMENILYKLVNSNNVTGSSEIEGKPDVTIYPNPTLGNLSVEFGQTEGLIQLRILQLSGELVERKQFRNTNRTNINLDVAPGFYLVEVNLYDGRIIRKKILKI